MIDIVSNGANGPVVAAARDQRALGPHHVDAYLKTCAITSPPEA